jgi:Leucine-rich repeat (LRR) protein
VNLDDTGIEAIASLKSLESVSLQANTKIIDAGVASFAGLTNLKSLTLRGKGITNDALRHFRSLTQLQSLDHRDTSVDQGAAARFKADDLQNVQIIVDRIE